MDASRTRSLSAAHPPRKGARSVLLATFIVSALGSFGGVFALSKMAAGLGDLGESALSASFMSRDKSLLAAVDISAAEAQSCAAVEDGRVFCWPSAQQAAPETLNRAPIEPPRLVENLFNAVQVAVGGEHVCARTRDGRVACWGSNAVGQLGTSTVRPSSEAPVFVSGTHDATRVVSGRGHSCALRSGGRVACWGLNAEGQLGLGDTQDRLLPAWVDSLTNIRQIAAGDKHTCALTAEGRVVCWGSNGEGQLGISAKLLRDSSAPIELPRVEDAKAISVGAARTCVSNESVTRCWGLPGDDANERRLPRDGTKFNLFEAGSAIACGSEDGDVRCWRQPFFQSRGTVVRKGRSISAKQLDGVLQLAAGAQHVCARDKGGAVYCWASRTKPGAGEEDSGKGPLIAERVWLGTLSASAMR